MRLGEWLILAIVMLLLNNSAYAASSGSFEVDDGSESAPSETKPPPSLQKPRQRPKQSMTALFVARKLACLAHWDPYESKRVGDPT